MSCGCDFQDEKRDNDCCDDLNENRGIKRKETNKKTRKVFNVPEVLAIDSPGRSTLFNQVDGNKDWTASKFAVVKQASFYLSLPLTRSQPQKTIMIRRLGCRRVKF
ncbi:hypothetical protein BgiBS90_013043 [Biomphalaria glabrata]|nr:hypothetical protein BgiBS90_013043 [Biomphalaria glabrata]